MPDEQIPRPQNAYLLFCRDFRERIKRNCPCDSCAYKKVGISQITAESQCVKNYSFKDVSKLASINWKMQSEEVKRYFHALSVLAKEIHKIEFPGYRYSPKPSRKNNSNKSAVFIDESNKFNDSEDSDNVSEPFSSNRFSSASISIELEDLLGLVNDQPIAADTEVCLPLNYHNDNNYEVENSKEKISCISEINVPPNPLDSSKNVNSNNSNLAFFEKQLSPKPSQNILVCPPSSSLNEQPQLMSSGVNDENFNHFDFFIDNYTEYDDDTLKLYYPSLPSFSSTNFENLSLDFNNLPGFEF
ncbi:206_t:CDS:1 [Ambispora gerdemannii]|uniref:206_t:CDS:1 n=1 Tax=Ambispora gerdemannii TaxID=144530 RepID=A0A9N8Z2T4_9GLOM|nr:206_t:CDS:1 [Ambispora gerdemannii]